MMDHGAARGVGGLGPVVPSADAFDELEHLSLNHLPKQICINPLVQKIGKYNAGLGHRGVLGQRDLTTQTDQVAELQSAQSGPYSASPL
jgi:hypothetical protein